MITISKNYKDFSIDATLTNQGALKILSGQEALENALRQWIVSFRGEINRKPFKGGYITNWLMKPMTEEIAIEIQEAIVDGIEEDFSPVLILDNIDVTPNYEQGYWEIQISGYSPEIKESFNISENIRNLT